MTKKILVADDSITIQKIVAMAFEKEEAVVEGISNGKDAFDKMEDFQPDIVLADVDMPGLTGFELSKKIKDDPKLNFTKVLLLASDFEEFNESLFKDSGADDHISKPFKSDDIIKRVINLLSEDTPTPDRKTIKLAAADMDEVVELVAADVIELSTDNLVEELDSTVELATADLEKPVEPTTTEPSGNEATVGEAQEAVLDEMIKDVDSLKGASEPVDTDSDYNELGEVDPSREDEIGDDLDTAFQEIVNFGLGKELDDAPSFRGEPIDESSDVDTIIPEPEDLLEKITPSALAGKKGISGPNLIQESLSYFSQISHESKIRQAMTAHRSERLINSSQSADTKDDPVVGEYVRQILENLLNTTIEKEIAGLSNSITQSVRKVVREITPTIAREIIKEEIEKIKKS